MLPLNLVGINMADDASETFGGGLRNYLGALGFILPLVGFEEFVRHFVDVDHPSLPWWLSVILMAAGLPIYVLPAIWKRLRVRRNAEAVPLQYLSHEDAELGPAVAMMAWRSAWGKWYGAQCLANSPKGTPDDRESDLMRVAARHVWQALIDGKLEARGRKPGQMDFEVVASLPDREQAAHASSARAGRSRQCQSKWAGSTRSVHQERRWQRCRFLLGTTSRVLP
jgi:hypothetical protein